MNISSFLKPIFFVFATLLLVSCDEDANEIGANIVGNDNFLGEAEPYEVLAYTQRLLGVESNNIKSDANGAQQLGIYEDGVFGKTTSHVVTEVRLVNNNPIDFSLSPRIKSAVLSIPYFSHTTGEVVDEETIYELDSIYGDPAGKLDLGIYESTFYIKPDPDNAGLPEPNYSHQLSLFGKGAKLNTSATVTQNTEFVFSKKEQTETSADDINNETTSKVSPRMKIELDTTVLGQRLFGPSAVGKMINNNIFTNYFRGLHFSVAQSGASPAPFAMMDFTKGKIVIKYEQKTSSTNATRITKYLTLTLNGNNVNLYEYQHSTAYANVLATAPNRTTGDPRLYLKGGDGSMAVIELFKNEAELTAFRANKDKWLVNDASLTFYIEQNAMAAAANEPNRIYLYDLTNNKPLVDFTTDQSTSVASVKFNKAVHGGRIEKSSDGRGTKYKIRITNYIRALLAEDTENVRLGLVVTENINTTSNKTLQTAINLPDSDTFGTEKKIDVIPTMSVANPFGTILYGSNIAPTDPDYEKRLKLTIYYTKPN